MRPAPMTLRELARLSIRGRRAQLEILADGRALSTEEAWELARLNQCVARFDREDADEERVQTAGGAA